MRQVLKLSLLALLGLVLTGCADISPGNLADIRPMSDRNRVGNVYLFRGFIGVFSTGMNQLGEELNSAGVRSKVFQSDQWQQVADTIADQYGTNPNNEPVVLVGHSYGADNIVAIAQRLKDRNVKIDLLITLDPVTPPKVPPNVVKVINLYQPSALDSMPFLRGIPLEEEKPGTVTLLNENLRKERSDLLESGLNHFNIEKKGKIHGEIIKQVLILCPPRTEWLAGRKAPANPANPTAYLSPGSSGTSNYQVVTPRIAPSKSAATSE